MSILSRFKDIMSSNINALLDKAEDPEKMVDQLLRNLNKDLSKVKAETASVMADEKRVKRELDECHSEINRFLNYAKKAVTAGNDDDAKMFLSKKVTLEEKATVLQQQYDLAKANTEKMKEMYQKLSSQIQELDTKRANIKAKMATAKMQKQANQMGAESSASSSIGAFEKMEQKVNRLLDEAGAMAELDEQKESELDNIISKYGNSTETSNVEDELLALKAEIASDETAISSESSSMEDELAVLKEEME